MKKLLLLAMLVAGCGPVKVTNDAVVQDDPTARIQVVCSQQISTKGNGNRSLLVVKDTKTGQEYMLVQGFGAVQMVMRGKVMVEE